MKEDQNTDYLLRYLQGRLEGEELQSLQSRLQQSQELRERLAELKATRALLQDTAATSTEDALAPFFTDRLMKKLEPKPATISLEEELAGLLSKLFRPVAIAGFFLSICLAVYNINLSNEYSSDSSTAESILAIPPVTSMAIYDLDYYSVQTVALP